MPLSAEISALSTESIEPCQEMRALWNLTQNLFEISFENRFHAEDSNTLSLVLGISTDSQSDAVSVGNLQDYKAFLLQKLNKATVIAMIESDFPSMIVRKLFTEWRNREFQNYDLVLSLTWTTATLSWQTWKNLLSSGSLAMWIQ